jgi:hypothetical protein
MIDCSRAPQPLRLSWLVSGIWIVLALALPLSALESLSQHIVHTGPAKYKMQKSVHGGAGEINYKVLLKQWRGKSFHHLDEEVQPSKIHLKR